MREDSLLLSLGLDSLKTVALSQRLRGRGLLVSPMDIIKAGSVSGVISASVTEGRQELPSDRENDSGVEQLLRQDLPADSIRLNPDDEVQITAATALQAGMLSQVTSVQFKFMWDIPCSPGFSRRPSLPRGNFMSTPSHSNSSNYVRSNS